MGAKLSRQSSSNDPSASQGSSFIELIKPECLKTKKTMMKKRQLQPPEKMATKVKKRQLQPPETMTTEVRNETLQDWLLASPGPGLRPDCLNGGELYVFKQFSKRVYPSATKVHQALYSTPRTSVSSDVYSVDGSSLSRSQSAKLKKRVSFKLPEEADIIIFYSPEETFESDQEIQDTL